MRMLKAWGGATVVVLALAACGRDGAAAAADEAQVMRTYAVPSAQLQSLERALIEVLFPEGRGSVSNSNGRLLVMASPGTQDSIAAAIEELAMQPANGAAGDAPIRLRFWLLDGLASPATPDPRLDPLKPALDEASRGLGLQGFTLQGFTDVLVSPGKRFESQAGNIVVKGEASRSASGVALHAGIDMVQDDAGWAGRLVTDATLDPDRFLVLGTNAAPDGSMKLIVAQAQLTSSD